MNNEWQKASAPTISTIFAVTIASASSVLSVFENADS